MAPAPQTLFGLFGDLTNRWPSDVVHEHTGVVAEPGDEPSPSTWLGALENSVRVQNVRTGSDPERVAVEAELTVDPGAGFLGYRDGWPFVITSMPDVEFRAQPYSEAGHAVRLFAAVGDGHPSLVIEGLPVEIRLPAGLVAPHPDEPGDATGGLTIVAGEFEAGRLDDLKVVYRRLEPTSVFVHVRLEMTEDFDFHIQPAVPITFDRCALSDIPCSAVHDFKLIPSPDIARDHHEWLRHSVRPWLPSHTSVYDGLFAVRSVDVDERAGAVKDAVDWLNGADKERDPTAEFVLEDVVVPFHGPSWLPIPRHLTAGVRRNVLDPGNKEEVFAFERAPVHVHVREDHRLTFNLESFFYRSLPAEDIEKDLGLTFRAAIVSGKDESPQRAWEIGVEENNTLTVGRRRDFLPSGEPAPGSDPEEDKVNLLLHWEVAQFLIVDVMAFRAGFSFGRKFGEDKSFWDSVLFTVDLFVQSPPTGKSETGFRLRSLNGQKVAFAMEGLGYRFGGPSFDGVALPDGVVIYFGPFALIISELGVTAENGASYLSFSGGLRFPAPADLEGQLTVKRLRVRWSGDEAQPKLKMDGFFARFKNRTVLIEAGGYYTEQDAGGTKVSEFGFTGTIDFAIGPKHHVIGLDLIVGQRSSPTESEFKYLMAQVFYAGQIGPLGGVELRSLRALYARNMLPKLRDVDKESRELRYFKWYLESDPLTVPGDRRLASWHAVDDSWAFGAGAGASFVGFGRLVELDLFVLALRGPAERGMLITARVFAMSNTEPLGFLAIELDRQNGRWSAVLGIDATLDKFMKNAPAWLAEAGGFTGTLFMGNDPDTFAIGRLADQSTWLTLRFEAGIWVQTRFVVGFCLELVEGGPKGFALTTRVEGKIGKSGAVKLTYFAGWSVVVLVFTTGSNDYSATITIEAGIRFVLFGFLRIGVSAKIEFRVVGSRPARGELTAEIRLETPWWLPDVTWRLDSQFGELAPVRLSTAVSPLRSVGVIEPGMLHQLPAHVERFDPTWNGEGVGPVHSVAELQAPTRPEAQRLANFAADTALRPVATDATIGVVWSVPVNDKLGLGAGMATGLGDQVSGDLALTYDLVGIAVRRRARFGLDHSWKPLEQKIELGADFSDPNGVQLDGPFGPQVLNKTWDVDARVDGQPAPKKLLVNGVAPYEFTTSDPEADEELVRFYPAWPCCRPPGDKDLHELFHRVSWHDAAGGVGLGLPGSSRFTESISTLRFLRSAWTHPAGFGGLPAGTMVAAAEFGLPGVLARADFDEDAAFCLVRMAWPRTSRVTLVLFDGAGEEVGRRDLGGGTAAFQSTLMGAKGPIRRLEVRGLRPAGVALAAASSGGTLVEIDEVAYVGLRDYLDVLTAQAACDGGVPGGPGGFEAKGKLAFLPNHEYELQFTTRVTVAHPSTAPEPADVDEFVYFATKGLPGLNAVARVGEELEPYVRGAYAGGRGGLVYREEPVTLAFSEDFHVAVPLAVRPPGTSEEQTKLLRMQLLVAPDIAATADTVFTATDEDWIVAHRGTVTPPVRGVFPWAGVKTLSRSSGTGMQSEHPLRARLATMTQRTGVPCAPGDPRAVTGTVLVAPPQGGGPDPSAPPPAELWNAQTRFIAVVRAERAGFVDRRPFAEGDQTSFLFGGGPASWTVVEGELRVEGSGRAFALFGDPDWDHLTVLAGIAPGAASAGVGFGLAAPGAAPRGLFVAVEPGRLVIRGRAATGGPLMELAAAELPAVGTEAISLEVTSFDDRLRAAVGEVVVEADRGEIREGRLCLTAEGPAAFGTLQVRGLDMYSFPFGVSRFRSFEEHVGSWNGRLDELVPHALGENTTSTTVGDLWAATGADVVAAMAPGAPAADRERHFAAWVAGLGLALKDEIGTLEVSRFVDGAMTRLLVLESPEPLDFTEEIAATMIQRKHVGGGHPFPPRPALGGGVLGLPSPHSLRDRLEGLTRAPSPHARPVGRPGVDETILDAEILDPGKLRLSLHPALANAGVLSVVVVEAAGPQLYRGLVRPPFLPGNPAILQAGVVGALPALPHGSELAAELAGAQPGTILLTTNDLLDLLGRFHLQPTDVDVPVQIQVLHSGDGRRALVIPLSGSFAAGPHRLTLSLERQRWQTTDPADHLNTYAGQATLSFDL